MTLMRVIKSDELEEAIPTQFSPLSILMGWSITVSCCASQFF
jgi:hypothetical protein